MTSKKRINRHQIISNLVEVPKDGKRHFWAREMTILKKLEAKFSLEFFQELKLDKLYPSLAYISQMERVLNRHWHSFNYKTDQALYPQYKLTDEKAGKPYKQKDNKPVTLKKFLNE